MGLTRIVTYIFPKLRDTHRVTYGAIEGTFKGLYWKLFCDHFGGYFGVN